MKRSKLISQAALILIFTNSFAQSGSPTTTPSAKVKIIGEVDKAESKWVYLGKDGKLIYKATSLGDKIMDFSHAGYMDGGVALPEVPVKRTVQPSGGPDDAELIQAAVDAVAALPTENGFRGAVLLGPGTFICSKTITISTNGVVLRGSGSGMNHETRRTTIKMTGDRHCAITISGGRNRGTVNAQQSSDDDEPASNQTQTAKPTKDTIKTSIADAYVPYGVKKFTVSNAQGFEVGDMIAIQRPTTPAWVKFMQMDNLKRDGKPQTWIAQTRSGITERKIMAISDNTLTLDIPLSDSYDSKYLNPPGTTVVKMKTSTSITQVGIEHLHIQCPPLEIAYGQAPYSAIRVGGDDCWVRDIYCEETMNTTAYSGKRITVEQVVVTHTFPNLGASKPSDFSIEGSQILINRCSARGGNTYFVWTGSLKPGPNVVLNSTFSGQGSRIQPHQRWSTGMLVDNCRILDGGIDFLNRGVAGSGHGWTMGWAVAWNCTAKSYVIQNPPGVANWAIGCIGTRQQTARLFDTSPILEEGYFDSYGTQVTPQSLYLAQLAERLGPQALKNIGYSSITENTFTENTLRPEPERQEKIDKVLGTDLGLHRPVNTNNVRGTSREFGGEKALDGNDKTYWATNDNFTRAATLEVDMEGPEEINTLEIGEANGFEQRVQEYKIEGQVQSDWKLLASGTTIGDSKIHRFPNVIVWKVRLTILKAQTYPAIRKFGLYLDKVSSSELFKQEPAPIKNK